jgi:hypothetical protein
MAATRSTNCRMSMPGPPFYPGCVGCVTSQSFGTQPSGKSQPPNPHPHISPPPHVSQMHTPGLVSHTCFGSSSFGFSILRMPRFIRDTTHTFLVWFLVWRILGKGILNRQPSKGQSRAPKAPRSSPEKPWKPPIEREEAVRMSFCVLATLALAHVHIPSHPQQRQAAHTWFGCNMVFQFPVSVLVIDSLGQSRAPKAPELQRLLAMPTCHPFSYIPSPTFPCNCGMQFYLQPSQHIPGQPPMGCSACT